MPKPKKERGRPVSNVLPPRIDAPAEEIADVVMRAKPKQSWRYMEEAEERRKQRLANS